jgi:hypothetical protein
MLKIVAIAAIGILPFLFNAGEANAQGKMGARNDSVRCPVNTCSKKGTERAKDVRNCSPANCRKNGPK